MSQGQLSHLTMLSVHKDLTDQLNLVHVANNFVFGGESCVRTFGHFWCFCGVFTWYVPSVTRLSCM